MQEDIKSRVELWLKDLGYKLDSKLYRKISKMSYHIPSYKIMAETVLKSINYCNPTINSDKAWKYTTKFVNGMKSNLIINNSYFQSVFENGLFSPYKENQDSKINLFNIKDSRNNEYAYLKNFWIKNNKNKKTKKTIFDFIVVINGFPLILIEIVNKDLSYSFEEVYSTMEEKIERFPMFFNFNKIILFTDGNIHKIGTLYNFPDEYINFYSSIKECYREGYHSIEELNHIFSIDNVLKILSENKNVKQLDMYLKNSLDQKVTFKENLDNNTALVKKTLNELDSVDNEYEIQDIGFLEENEDLMLLEDFFYSDLDEVIESEEFKKRLEKIREVPDFKENREYIEEIQIKNNKNTIDTFVKANEKLVVKEVNKFINYQTPSMDFDDMYQLGYVGLLEAMKRFDLNMENEFSTYAVYWIRKSIIRGINNDSLLIRIPSHQWDLLLKLKKLENRSETMFSKLDYDWISKELDISKDKIKELIMIRKSYMNNVSLDTPVSEDGYTVLEDFIVDKDYSVEEIILNMDLRTKLENVLDTLDARSKDIIIKRFGLYGQRPMTLEEIGNIYCVTRERIRQIESEALNRLSNISMIKKIKEYSEG